MESVKSFALSTCVSLVIGSIISMIVPNIEKNKIFKVILSAFMLAGLVSPISSLIKNENSVVNISSLDNNKYSDCKYDENTLQNVENSASITLYPVIKGKLESLGLYDDFGINLILSSEKEGIKIKTVNINIWDLHSIEKDKLQADLTKKTGLPINIVANESEDSQNVWWQAKKLYIIFS